MQYKFESIYTRLFFFFDMPDEAIGAKPNEIECKKFIKPKNQMH